MIYNIDNLWSLRCTYQGLSNLARFWPDQRAALGEEGARGVCFVFYFVLCVLFLFCWRRGSQRCSSYLFFMGIQIWNTQKRKEGARGVSFLPTLTWKLTLTKIVVGKRRLLQFLQSIDKSQDSVLYQLFSILSFSDCGNDRNGLGPPLGPLR